MMLTPEWAWRVSVVANLTLYVAIAALMLARPLARWILREFYRGRPRV